MAKDMETFPKWRNLPNLVTVNAAEVLWCPLVRRKLVETPES